MRFGQSLLSVSLSAVAVVCLLAVSQLAAQENEPDEESAASITDELAGLQAAVERREFTSAWQHCRRILSAVEARDSEALTGPEQFAVGMAHYYLAAQILEAAVATGELTKEDAALASNLGDRIVLPPSDIHMIGFGEEVRLDEYLGEGKTTIVDFFSKYCGPCLQLSPLLEELAAKGSNIRVVKVNIDRPGVVGIDWDSPVAEQFGLRSIPHSKVYGPDKQLLTQGDQAIQMILDLYRSQDVRQAN